MPSAHRSAIETGMSHFYLYSKGHYVQTNLIQDLKRITAHRCGLNPEQVTVANIILLLLREVDRLTEGRTTILEPFVTYIREELVVWPTLMNKQRQPSVDEVIIQACLNELSMTVIRDGNNIVFELEPPNPDVLPLTPSASPNNANHTVTQMERG